MGLISNTLANNSSIFLPPDPSQAVPDFTVEIKMDPMTKMSAWLLKFSPPARHHFNEHAPMRVIEKNLEIKFIQTLVSPMRMEFRSSDQKLKEGSKMMASFFLCDDAKIYCHKKKLSFDLKVTSP